MNFGRSGEIERATPSPPVWWPMMRAHLQFRRSPLRLCPILSGASVDQPSRRPTRKKRVEGCYHFLLEDLLCQVHCTRVVHSLDHELIMDLQDKLSSPRQL